MKHHEFLNFVGRGNEQFQLMALADRAIILVARYRLALHANSKEDRISRVVDDSVSNSARQHCRYLGIGRY